MQKPKKTFLIFLMGFIIGLSGFIFTFIKYQNKEPEETKDFHNEVIYADSSYLFFKDVHNSLMLESMIPTLDKFGVMNEAFTFTIGNNDKKDALYTLSLLDDDSTIPNKDVRYQLMKNNEEIGIFTLENDGIIDTGKISPNEEVSYSLRFWLDYNSEIKVGKFKKKIMLSDGIMQKDKVNAPILVDGMIPVTYDQEKMVFVKSNGEVNINNEWYNYNKGNWANAVTVNLNSRDAYSKASPGTEIKMDDINAFWVWIPRFKYLISDYVEIEFVDTNEDAFEAFTFNNIPQKGIWVSKFEAGISEDSACIRETFVSSCNKTNNTLLFKPDVPFMHKITMANLFYNIRSMELKNNIYGFLGNGTKLEKDGTIKNDDNKMDIHMIKNSEWQAVSLLSLSKYGNNKIAPNNENNAGKAYVDNNTYSYNTPSLGTQASTTKTIYGIYDMSGGKRELVMLDNNLFVKNSNSGFTTQVKDYYYDKTIDNSVTLLNRMLNLDYQIGTDIITRGGYHNIDGDILNIAGVNDYINKISNETNSRAVISFTEGDLNG